MVIDELHKTALRCVANYKRCEKHLIEILESIDRHKAYLALGVSSLFRYCVEKLGLSESESYRFIQVMRKSAQIHVATEGRGAHESHARSVASSGLKSQVLLPIVLCGARVAAPRN